MKKLVPNPLEAQYVIEGEPQLIVLGIETPERFAWINSGIDAVDNPAQLEDLLKGEAYYLPVEFNEDFEPGEIKALVIHLDRLMALAGRPVARNEAWQIIAELAYKNE